MRAGAVAAGRWGGRVGLLGVEAALHDSHLKRLPFPSSEDSSRVRADIASRFAGVKALDGIAGLAFGKATTARDWLQASNPSERWKWDFMFQDLPPLKGQVELSSLPPAPVAVIPLKEVK